jgi:hypothetical protein
MADKILYATKINGNPIAASAIVPESALADKIAEIEQEIVSVGSYEVVPLTSGANPVPNVADPKTTVIYLTKDSESTAKDPYTEWIYIAGTPSGSWEIIGETTIDLSGYKTKQTAVNVTGGTLKGVASFAQNANGEVTLTLNDIQAGTTAQKGVVQLEDSTSSTSTTMAATPASVKSAYDLAAGKQDPITFDGTYSATTNKAATVSTVTNATSGKADKVTGATSGNFAGLDANGNLTDSGSKAADFATAAQGTKADSAIQSVKVNGAALTPDENKAVSIPNASTSAKGVVQLAGTISATVSAENNKAASEKAVRDAINALGSEQTSTDGTNVQVKVTEANGKITAVNVATDNTENKNNKVSAWSETTTDAHYPSEKLVKDSLDGKADKAVPAASGNFAALDANGNLTDSGSKAADFKTIQSAVTDPTVPSSGITTATAFIDTISQDVNGVITPTKKSLPTASTSGAGIVQLEDSTSSTATNKAATPASVKSAYDLANGKYSKPSGGIPKTDLATAVQTSLGKADSAIQSVKVNGTALTPDTNKAVDIPVATSEAYGVVTVETLEI